MATALPTPFTRNTLSWSNSIAIPAGGHEHGYAVANDDGVGMIAFKLSPVEQLHGEDVQRLTAAEFMEYSIEVIRGHGFVLFDGVILSRGNGRWNSSNPYGAGSLIQ